MTADYDLELYRLKADMCKTFADPKRLIIIEALRKTEKSVGELSQTMCMPQAIVSRHLAILRNRGVVKTRRQGTNIYYSLTDPKICEACDLVHNILLNQIKETRRLAERVAT